MYSFFVLGQIPGTDITITFSMWMQLCAALLAIALLIRVHRRNTQQRPIQPTISQD